MAIQNESQDSSVMKSFRFLSAVYISVKLSLYLRIISPESYEIAKSKWQFMQDSYCYNCTEMWALFPLQSQSLPLPQRDRPIGYFIFVQITCDWHTDGMELRLTRFGSLSNAKHTHTFTKRLQLIITCAYFGQRAYRYAHTFCVMCVPFCVFSLSFSICLTS